MLTLASNERIPLRACMRLIFEIRDLAYASPATVSRAGIIFISTSTGSQWRSLVTSWLEHWEAPSESARAVLGALFERYVAPALDFMRRECRPLVPVEDITLVTNLLRMLRALLTPAVLRAAGPDAPPADAERALDTVFVFAAVWAFGGALSLRDGEDYRQRFSDFWRGEFKSVRLPSRETVFDYWLSPDTLTFEQWKASPHFSVVAFNSQTTPMATVTVPTPETCSTAFWMDVLVNSRDPVMLVGYAGCGKTQLVAGLLAQHRARREAAAAAPAAGADGSGGGGGGGSGDHEGRLSVTINFNFYTDARALQVSLEAPLEKKTGTNFGPPGTAGLIYFLDDLNLPEVDKYDTQSAIALVRQHLDYGHWYDRTKLQLRAVAGCQYVAAMNPAAGSFTVNPRLQRHFHTMAVAFPGPTSLHTIYNTFLEGHLASHAFSEEARGAANALLSGALQLHAAVAAAFRKSATNFHYEFNIRHLSAVFQGLLMARPAEFRDAGQLAMLWLHESERVYGDRLVCAEDLAKYRALAAAKAKQKFATLNLNNFFGEHADPLCFSHFAAAGGGTSAGAGAGIGAGPGPGAAGVASAGSSGARAYDRVTSMDDLRTVLEAALAEYNEGNAAMNLVLFDDALRHVCRITRIISNPAGHALLVGVGGSGKQSLARLAAHMCGYRVFQVQISGGYGLADFKEDIKAMYSAAGVRGEGVAFLFSDAQVTNERFLVVLNDLLASGNIPDLFSAEEVDAIVAVRPL